VKLLLDEHYANQIALELRTAGHDAGTVSELQIKHINDEALLELAASDDRALLTNNARDLIPLVGRWATCGRDHGGLLPTLDGSMPRHKGTIGLYVHTLRAIMEASAGPRAREPGPLASMTPDQRRSGARWHYGGDRWNFVESALAMSMATRKGLVVRGCEAAGSACPS
jgi:hypothetical protein